MASLLENEQTIRQQAQLFDDVRPAGVQLFLLKRSGQTEKFSIVAGISSGWFAFFDKQFRDELKISIATLDSNFGDLAAQSSFLAYGPGQVLDVYTFEKKDAVSPNATSPSWKIFAARSNLERFTAPEPEIADGGVLFRDEL